MLKRDELLPYLIISAAMHVVVMLLVFNGKAEPLFVSAPIDVTFYTPAQTRSDPPPAAVPEETKAPEPDSREVKETPAAKEDVTIKKKEKPQESPKPKPKPKTPAKKEEPKKAETEAPPQPQSQNVSTVQAPGDVRYEAAGTQFEGLSFDSANFKYAYYTNTIVRKISRFWQWSDSYGRRRAVVYFKIARDGSVSSITVKESSGDAGFDDNARRSVQLASPFAPLPEGYSGGSLGVYFEFKYRN